jgi:hypothetical protein
MSEPLDNPDLMALLADKAVEIDAEVLRRMEFHDRVPDIPNPLGALLRQVAHAHNEYEKAFDGYGTTEGEPRRWMPVLDEAVSLVEWMRDGGQL